MPDRDAMIEAGAEAVYEAMPVVLKDLVSRAEAEAAIGVPHGVGVPDRWLAAAVLDVVRPLILREAAEKMRERDEFAALDCGCYSHAADLLERLADGNTTTDNVGSQVECERLMSWPDDWTAIDGADTPDSRRYAACGDGVVSNVAEWIARGILREDAA